MFNLRVSVDEVLVPFHAADSHGLSVNDLELNELTLLDDGKAPEKIISFQRQQDAPLRAAILMDTSPSMWPHRALARSIATRYAQQVLRKQTDTALVMQFEQVAILSQSWTNDRQLLVEALRAGKVSPSGPAAGTAIFDALYRVCRYHFGATDYAHSGNLVLLFSDGEDNGSSMSLKDAVDMCQHTNTAVYAFRAPAESGSASTGPEILAALAEQTGGLVFREDASPDEIHQDLGAIESNLRSQYRLIYRPATLAHDGSFHHITLVTPDRAPDVVVRSGYYAPAH